MLNFTETASLEWAPVRVNAVAPGWIASSGMDNYPPAMKDGYIDGCESAKGSVHGRRDERRLASDAQYSQGWKDGFSICGKRQ